MCASDAYIKKTNKCNFFSYIAKTLQYFTFLILIFAFFNFCNISYKAELVYAESDGDSIEQEIGNSVDNVLNDVDFSGLEELVDNLGREVFNNNSFRDYVLKIINGEELLGVDFVFDTIKKTVAKTFKNILSPLLLVLVIVLICNMFNNIKSKVISGVGEVIYFICFSIIVLIISKLLSGVISDARGALLNLRSQMNSMFPVLLTLMGTMGGDMSIKVYSPMFAFLSNTISNIFLIVLLPLFSVSLILSIVGNLSENTKLEKLNGFIFSLFKWVIGVVFAVYMGFMSINGMIAGASDGISIKATKYAIKNYIPLLGGYISEGFEAVKAGALLVKNATGFVGILLLIATIIAPIVILAVLELGLKFLAGVIEPLGDVKTSRLLYGIGKSLKLLVVVLFGVSLMYFFTIYLVTCSVANFV